MIISKINKDLLLRKKKVQFLRATFNFLSLKVMLITANKKQRFDLEDR